MPVSRRQLLLGGSAVALGGLVAGSQTAEGHRLIDRLDPPHANVPGGATGPLISGVLDSEKRQRTVDWVISYPPGSRPGDHLPVALVLHGRGGTAGAAFDDHKLHHFLADAVRKGTRPFALASVDGGSDTYWHARRDGDDPQGMLLQEVLPLLAKRGLQTDRFGLTGWSMGGYGALLLATVVPERVTGVAVDAPALWRRAKDAAPGAFDGAEDFAKHDVLAQTTKLTRVPVRVGCGRSDPFVATDRQLAKALPAQESSFPRGVHDLACWNLLRPGDLSFLGKTF